jgi:hypothetical protein
MSKIFYLCSNDRTNYNKVKYSRQFCSYGNIYYRIHNFTSFGNYSVLISDDYIILKIDVLRKYLIICLLVHLIVIHWRIISY